MDSGKKYIKEVDALKGIAITLVILGHSIIVYPVNLHDNPVWAVVFSIVSSVHVPLFFVVSGFCFSYSGGYKEYLKKKTARILIPFMIFNFIDLIVRDLFPNAVNHKCSTIESLKQIALRGGGYWFLYVLFIIFIIYPLIYSIIKNSMKRMIVFEMITCFIACTGINIDLFKIQDIMYYLFFFNSGVLLKIYNKNIFNEKNPVIKALIKTSVLIIIWMALIFCQNDSTNIFISCIAVTDMVVLTNFKIVNNCFAKIGKYSLQLYLLNGFFLVISRTFVCRFTAMGIVIVFVNLLFDLGGAYVFIKYICDRNKYIRLLMGM